MNACPCLANESNRIFLEKIGHAAFACEVEQVGGKRTFHSIFTGDPKAFEYLKQVQNYSGPHNQRKSYLLIIISKSPGDFVIYSIRNESIRYGLGREDVISIDNLKIAFKRKANAS